MAISVNLLRKYNVPGPRYTSYPTVPYWETHSFTSADWKERVMATFRSSGASDGLAVYIHLPYCESMCTYCACTTRITVNHAVEEPYIRAVLAEWQMYLDQFDQVPVIRELHLGGGTPTFFSADNLELLIRGILKGVQVHPDHEFSFEGHPNNTTRLHLQTLYDLGFRRVSFGIQDFDPRVQEIIHRVQPEAQVARVTAEAREIGYSSVNYDLVYGLPLQTRGSVMKTIRKVLKYRPERIAFYGYAHVPWVKPGQRSFTEKDLPLNEEKHKLYEIGREMFLEAGYADIGMDHFALPTDRLFQAWKAGTMHRNFMGYTPLHTDLLIGLGASAISDCWTAFAQNHKRVETYMEAVKAGDLPVHRGHLHTAEDVMVRQHILDLMCRYETNWTLLEREAYGELSDRLTEMVADGLLSLDAKGLHMSKKGRPFVRNACMALDMRMLRRKPSSQLFSSTV